MKCVMIDDVKKLVVKDIPEPKKEEKKVQIKVLKNGICGSDLHYFEHGEPKGLIMGHEFCGEVIDPGSREDLKSGDRVTALPISPCLECPACMTANYQFCLETWNEAVGLSLGNPGGLAEIINIREDMVVKVPDTVTDDEAAMVEPTAVALHGIHLANIKVGDKVLVIGGGIIGLESAMFAKKEGASYVALSEINETRGEMSVKLGVADEWFKADQDLAKKLAEKVPDGFDVVIECCGNSAAVTSSLMNAKTGGVVVLVGVSLNPITIPMTLGVMHELTIKGAIGYTKEEFIDSLELIEKKHIDVLKFLSEIVSFDEVQSSFAKLMDPKGKAIKILVDPKK